jgi:hypothetical protein
MNSQSPLFSLNYKDLIKGLVMAALTGIFNIVMADINQNIFAFNGAALYHGAIVGLVAYLAKNFFTPAVATQTTTTTPDGTVTEKVISTDSLNVKVDAIK